MKDLAEILKDLDTELERSKMFVNQNGYHHGTSINRIVHRYRTELKELREAIRIDIVEDGIKNYSECEIHQ